MPEQSYKLNKIDFSLADAIYYRPILFSHFYRNCAELTDCKCDINIEQHNVHVYGL